LCGETIKTETNLSFRKNFCKKASFISRQQFLPKTFEAFRKNSFNFVSCWRDIFEIDAGKIFRT